MAKGINLSQLVSQEIGNNTLNPYHQSDNFSGDPGDTFAKKDLA
jgi:hypothetical protein